MDLYTSQTSCMDAYMKPHEVLELLSETSKFWSKKKTVLKKQTVLNRFFYSTEFENFFLNSVYIYPEKLQSKRKKKFHFTL